MNSLSFRLARYHEVFGFRYSEAVHTLSVHGARPSRPLLFASIAVFLLSAAFAVAGGLQKNTLWMLLAKPVPMLLLIAWAFSMPKSLLTRGVCTALCFSLVGDVLLIWPEAFFIWGLLAFLCGHLAYITAFSQGVSLPLRPAVRMPFIVFAAAMWAVLHEHLGPILKFAVAAYAIVLVSMAAQTWIWHAHHKTRTSHLALWGSALFVASDALLALNRFHTPIPWPSLWILLTYYAGQALLTASISNPELTRE